MKNKFFLKTDVLPSELPINFTNKNLYLAKKDFSNKIYTIPYNFEIPKPNSINNRVLSLPHPIAQLQMMNFIDAFKFNITSFCSLSPFSIRSPYKINSINTHLIKRKLQKITYDNEQFFNADDKYMIRLSYNDVVEEYHNFFRYKKFSMLTQFLNSPIYHRSKSKYDNFMKLDIQNYFDSIYTHSIEWALAGDKYSIKTGSLNTNTDDFLKAIDLICQQINYKETNGIIIGPEFSRIISEILLTRIDLNIFRDLFDVGLKYNKDYIIYRYIDDYFIFFNNVSDMNDDKIKGIISNRLKEYKLSLNDNKYALADSKTTLEDDSIVTLIKVIDYFSQKYFETSNFDNRMKYISNFLIDFEVIIQKYPTKKQKLVRYTLKSLNKFIKTTKVERDRKLIFELALHLFSHSPEYYSSRYYYTFFLKCIEFSKKEKMDKSLLRKLDEDAFHFMVKALKQNSNHFPKIYDLLIAMKFLDKKISSSLLCSLIEKHKNDYFSLCTIALYILNEDKIVTKQYIIVLKKIISTLDFFLKNYTQKSPKKYQDAFYFYLINDFYHYPGFNKNFITKKIHMSLKNEYNEMKKNMNLESSVTPSEIDVLINRSYFNWTCKFEWFFKRSILKSENISNDTINSDY
ncbi:RNA-directed DNA polymerase [Jeotgalibacillus sp. JSM ZJ347]|uniref:RNA-directed DNA polymerase n=1 Tax=Jeotgalibacillus sp. JSM ZJ347 TaxID=3342117 RepID=UPI0035A9ABA0